MIAELAKIVGLAALYFLGGKLGLSLATLHLQTSAFWPPTGISLAALLLFGYRLWPGVAIGALLVNLTSPTGALASSLAIAVGNTLEALLGAYLVNRFANGSRALERARDFFKLVALAAMGSTTVSATIGATSICLSDSGGFGSFFDFWLTWWLGDLVGDVVMAPLALLWWHSPRFSRGPAQWAEVGLSLLAVTITALVIFSPTLSWGSQALRRT